MTSANQSNDDQDAGPPGNGISDGEGPHPDPPIEEPEDDDEVDEGSKLSFPTSDPPATWAGSDDPPQ